MWPKKGKSLFGKSLSKSICNLILCRTVVQCDGSVMHQFPNVVHVNFYVLSPMLLNMITRDIDYTLVVTINIYCRWSLNPKLCQDSMQPNYLNSYIHSSPILCFCWRKCKGCLLLAGPTNWPRSNHEYKTRGGFPIISISYPVWVCKACEIKLCSNSIMDPIINSTHNARSSLLPSSATHVAPAYIWQ